MALARHAGALVIATVRSKDDVEVARRAGAHHVVETAGLGDDAIVELVRVHAPDGVDHVVEVAFHANIATDEKLLKVGGSVATYATNDPSAPIPFWPLLFKNIRIDLLGSDDFPPEAKQAAALALNETLKAGWPGFAIDARFPLESIASAHEAIEGHKLSGRVVLTVGGEEQGA